MNTDKDDIIQTEKDENGIGKSYFPIEIVYEGEKERKIINHPNNLTNKPFKVYRTRIKL